MFRIRQISWCVLCAVSVAGCASFTETAGTPAWRIAPNTAAAQGYVSADAAYHAGRHYHGSLRYDRALAAYRQAVQLNPGHVEARNGLGVLFSSIGRHDDAVRELEAAVALAPHRAHLRNNLGYAHFLRGSLPSARKEFEEAKRLDPSSRRAEENLRLVQARLNSPESTPASSSPARHRNEAGNTPAPGPKPAPKPASAGIIMVAPQIYEMRELKPAAPAAVPSADKPEPSRPALTAVAHMPASVATDAAAPSTAFSPAKPRLEVSNGNGVNGFARRMATTLSRLGWSNTTRLTNQIPFRQTVTEVQYREGYAIEATRLAAGLKSGVIVIRNDSLAAQVDIRLVLGRDAWTESQLLRRDPSNRDSAQVVAQR
jgi:tetratricopeptide (TPR) repeat protein